MKMYRKFLFLGILMSGVISCQKEKQATLTSPVAISNQQNLSLDQAKQWYKTKTLSGGQINMQSTGQGLNLSRLSPPWERAQSFNNKKGNYWLMHLYGQPVYQNVKQGYRKLAIFRDSTGNIQARILEIIPDVLYIQRKQRATTTDFTGRIFIYDQNYHFLNGKILANGKQIGEIKVKIDAFTNDQKLKVQMVQISESCTWYDDNYIDSEGVVTIYSERVCDYTIYDDGGGFGGGGGGFDGGSGDYAGGGGGGGGEASSSPAASNLPGVDHPAVNPRAYMNCFGNIADAGATMKVTVYVQEPFPGTTFNYGPNSVGHTAIGLSKSSGNTTISQTVGFYPDASGKSKFNAPSKLVDNSGLDYNTSITYTVDAVVFANLINYISNPPATYNLSDFNCTNFVYSACQYAGITLPNPYTTVGLGGPGGTTVAMTPAGLGSSIDNLKGQPGVNTNGGNIPTSKGPCN